MTDAVGDTLLESLSWEHERVQLVQDEQTGLRAIVAIHSTVLGPALGGMRIRRYEGGMAEALDDALRLARAMTLKASSAGLDLGGGKSVMLDDGRQDRRRERLAALAREVDRLGGAYITSEDIGTTTADMDFVAQHTRHVVGCSPRDGVGGDPSPATARTVMGAIQAALDVVDGSDSLAGRSVGVIGLGKVGGQMARWLLDAGARVVGFDAVPAVAGPLAEAGVELVEGVDDILARDLDVVAPCAVGGVVDEGAATRLRCRIVCGAANNPLAGERTAELLADRDILYVPDFVANCGGLIHADAQRRDDSDPARLEQALAGARERARRVLLEALESGRLPDDVARDHAWARIAAARGGVAEAVA